MVISLNMEQIKSLSDEDKGLYIEAKESNLKSRRWNLPFPK